MPEGPSPVIDPNQALHVDENEPDDTVVGTVGASDPDTSVADLTFEIGDQLEHGELSLIS